MPAAVIPQPVDGFIGILQPLPSIKRLSAECCTQWFSSIPQAHVTPVQQLPRSNVSAMKTLSLTHYMIAILSIANALAMSASENPGINPSFFPTKSQALSPKATAYPQSTHQVSHTNHKAVNGAALDKRTCPSHADCIAYCEGMGSYYAPGGCYSNGQCICKFCGVKCP